MMLLEQTFEHSGNTNLSDIRESLQEAAARALFAPLAASKGAVWLDASTYTTVINPDGSRTDDAAYSADQAANQNPIRYPFALADRVGGRQFRRGFLNKHPCRVAVDELSGKPCFLFGVGGTGTNALSNAGNGEIWTPSILDAAGVEINQKPDLLKPGGYSWAFVLRMAQQGQTINGATVGQYPGGTVIGASATAATAFRIGFDYSTGQLNIYHGNTQVFLNTTDHRDNLGHRYQGWYDAAAGTIGVLKDGVALTNVRPSTAVTTDIPAVTGTSAIMRIGSWDDPTTPSSTGNQRLTGAALSFVGFLQQQSGSPAHLSVPANQAIMTALMATK